MYDGLMYFLHVSQRYYLYESSMVHEGLMESGYKPYGVTKYTCMIIIHNKFIICIDKFIQKIESHN